MLCSVHGVSVVRPVRSADCCVCGVSVVRSVRSADCFVCDVSVVRSVRSADCFVCDVSVVRSVRSADCFVYDVSVIRSVHSTELGGTVLSAGGAACVCGNNSGVHGVSGERFSSTLCKGPFRRNTKRMKEGKFIYGA